MTRRGSPAPGRREVLAAGGALAVSTGLSAGLAGCLPGTDAAPPPRPDPELRLRSRIAAEVTALAARYDAVVAAFPGAGGELSTLAAEHLAHAEALLGPPGARPSESDQPSTSPAPSASPVPDAVPDTLPAAIAGLSAAERAAARRRTLQVGRVSPELARLLASVAACESAHAALLDGGR